MVESGDWLTPRFNYTDRFQKPVLYYWLAALSYRITGVGEAAARFPSALAGLGLTLVVFAAGRRWYDPQTGFLAGAITATSFGYVAMARQSLPDLVLAFFITLTTWAAFVAWLDDSTDGAPSRGGRTHRRRWVVLSAAAAAGAVLTKGPVGLALPALVVGPLVGWEAWTGRSQLRIRASDLVLGAVVFVVLAAPWFIGMAEAHGLAYLDRFFIGENIDRFASARYNAPRPLWYYLPIVVGGMLPWSPFMLLWVSALNRSFRQRFHGAIVGGRLVWWAAAPFLFYTLSVGKQPRYILPMLPPLAVLLARAVREHATTPGSDRVFSVCTAIAGGLLCLVGGLVYRARPVFVEWDPTWIAGVALLMGLAGAAVLVSIVRRRWVPTVVIAASALISIAAHTLILSSPGASPVERVAEMVLDAREVGEPYGRSTILSRNLIFYTRSPFVELPNEQAVVDFMGSPGRVVSVLLDEEVEALLAQGLTVRRLGDVRYFNTGSLTLEVLIDPDPDRYVRRLVVVSNR